MCTASWSVGSGRATLCFNRDERKDRPRARVPKVMSEGGLAWIAPIDPTGGGTWLLVNQYGVCVFLLNNYAAMGAGELPSDRQSRGLLPMRFFASKSLNEVEASFKSLDVQSYQPFHLCAIDGYGYCGASWDGVSLERRSANERFITTSSFRTKEVEAYRETLYQELLGSEEIVDVERRRAYHMDTSHEDPAFNPFMLREESETHCMSVVEIGKESVAYEYWERVSNEIKWKPPVNVILSRSSGVSS